MIIPLQYTLQNPFENMVVKKDSFLHYKGHVVLVELNLHKMVILEPCLMDTYFPLEIRKLFLMSR